MATGTPKKTTRKGLVMHFSQTGGGRPVCGNRRAHSTTSVKEHVNCTRCQAVLARWEAKKNPTPEPTFHVEIHVKGYPVVVSPRGRTLEEAQRGAQKYHPMTAWVVKD
jgi:hypothetical protein